jgi:hypothetical protein
VRKIRNYAAEESWRDSQQQNKEHVGPGFRGCTTIANWERRRLAGMNEE